MKASGRLAAAAAVLVLAIPAGASGAARAHRRHVAIRSPTVAAGLRLGTDGRYTVGIGFEEPDLAMLTVGRLDSSRLGVEATKYGTHFHGSLLGGRVTADFGPVGSVAVRFRPDGAARERRPSKGCEGRAPRSESGHWVGSVSLHGEDGYFAVSTASAGGERTRTFRLRCHVDHPMPQLHHESLRERVESPFGSSLMSILLGNASRLLAEEKEGGRQVALRAAHVTGAGPGAEVEAGAFEYQGRMPVGRFVQILEAPAGSLVTTLPGEHPATATLKPGAPFSGEATYLATSPTTHSWTGTLAVRFPGLVAPLTGARFYSSLCVVSPLVKPHGCQSQSPNLQGGGDSAGDGRP